LYVKYRIVLYYAKLVLFQDWNEEFI